jgi:hypothetical protein
MRRLATTPSRFRSQTSQNNNLPFRSICWAFSLRPFSFALRQWAFERFYKLGGIANIAVHFHDHFDVGVLDPVCVDKIRHAKTMEDVSFFIAPPNPFAECLREHHRCSAVPK